jgi:DNA repair exonuclease SbcCD ATPase subunit
MMSAKHTKSIRVVSDEQQAQPTLQGTAEYKQWFDELREQKQYIVQLQEELDGLQELVKKEKKALKEAEERLFAFIEELGEQHFPPLDDDSGTLYSRDLPGKLLSLCKQWFDELREQKQYIVYLQEELDQLREAVKVRKEDLKSAEARLFALIEEAGQQYLPFSEATQESVDA